MKKLFALILALFSGCAQSYGPTAPPYEPPPEEPPKVFTLELRLDPESPWFEYIHQNQGGDYTAWKFEVVLTEIGGAAGRVDVLGLNFFSDEQWVSVAKVINWTPGEFVAGETKTGYVDCWMTACRISSFSVWYPVDDGHGTTRQRTYKYRVVWDEHGVTGRGVFDHEEN